MRFSRISGVMLFAAGVLVGGVAQAGCNLQRLVSLPVHVDGGRIFVAGMIDAHPVDYLVDPASPSVLMKAAADEWGVYPDMLGTLQEQAVLGDPSKGPDAAVPVQHLPMVIRGTLPNLGSPQKVTILGMTFLSQFDVEFDVAHGKVTLFHPVGCEAAKLSYWDKTASVAAMVPNLHQVRTFPPFTIYSYPHVNIMVKVDGRDMRAALDSGYRDSALSLAAATSLGVKDGVDTARTPDLWDAYSVHTWTGHVDRLAIDRETVSPVTINYRTFIMPEGVKALATGTDIERQRDAGDDVVLGADFFLSHRIYIAYSQSKVYITPVAGRTYLGSVPSVAADVASSAP